jgi:arabinose-5-phosphate isomerase
MSIKTAKKVLDIEAKAINALKNRIDKSFSQTLDVLVKTKGRVIVTGMGKSGFIARKISATLSSTGTPSLYLHPAEALHGDLGRVTKDDCIIALSNSGETEEVCRLLPAIKKIGASLIAMVGNKKSTLAKNADLVLDVSVKEEACSLGLAPTTSTTVALAMGDALCVALLDAKGFKSKDFALFHPAGSLGKKLLLTVEDIMRKAKKNPVVKETELIKSVLVKITRARAGSACVVNKIGKLVGIFTDGDLRRHIDSKEDIRMKKVGQIMTKKPITIKKDKLAAEALRIMQTKKIDEIPVVDKINKPVGLLDVQDILDAGLV